MSSASEYHNQAMDTAFFADRERRRGNVAQATALFEEALELELAAIAEMPRDSGMGWDVLHRSAGSLALECNRVRLAEQLASKVLAGDPNPAIAEEVRDLWEQASFRRHLEPRGIELGQDEMQLSLVGRSVAAGTTLMSDLISRMDNFQTLIYRIVQRRTQLPYSGTIARNIRNGYRAFASVPRAGSFAMSLRLAHPSEQPSFSGMLGTGDIMMEFLDLMELANGSNMQGIEQRIPDPAYRRNFLGLARRLAPDGDRIRQVGFTLVLGEDSRSVSVTTPTSHFPPTESRNRDSSIVEISGTLRYANASHSNRNQIKVVEYEGGPTHTINVPTGLMDDIVSPMWNTFVTARGSVSGRQRNMRLQEIWQSEPVENQPTGRRVVADGSRDFQGMRLLI